MQALPTPGTLVADKYRIELLLGEGGMGAVYRANHEVMDKAVALKWLHPELTEHAEAKARFLREARAAARIRHPNVVDVYDVGTHGEALFLVMELLEGESFEALLARGETPLSDALALLLGAMHGVAAAHQRGIVHRDIKPENLFVEHDDAHPVGIAKVLDFGISKLADDRSRQVTQTGHTMGTPTYMSLEQINGVRDIDARTDVYAFGVMLYRTLTGELPFDGPTFGAIAVQVATRTPPLPSQLRPALPPAIDAVVMRAIARDRSERFQTMRELIEALTAIGLEFGLLTSQIVQLPSLTPKTPMPRMASSIPPAGVTVPMEQQAALPAPREPTPASPRQSLLPQAPALVPELAQVLPPPREPTPHAPLPVPRKFDARSATPTKALLAMVAPSASDSVAPASPAASTLPASHAQRSMLLLGAVAAAALLIGAGSLVALSGPDWPAPSVRALPRPAALPPRLPTMPRTHEPAPPLETAPTAVVPTGLSIEVEEPELTPLPLAAEPAALDVPAPTGELDAATAPALKPRTPRAARASSAPSSATVQGTHYATGRRSGTLSLEELTE